LASNFSQPGIEVGRVSIVGRISGLLVGKMDGDNAQAKVIISIVVVKPTLTRNLFIVPPLQRLIVFMIKKIPK
jgi:hypothetical protein